MTGEQNIQSLKAPWYYLGFSALDRYYRGRTRATSYAAAPETRPHELIVVDSELTALAESEFTLEFPGIEGIDCVLKDPSNNTVDYFVILAENKDDVWAKLSEFSGLSGNALHFLKASHHSVALTLEPGLYDMLRQHNFPAVVTSFPVSDIRQCFALAVLLSRYSLGPYGKTAEPDYARRLPSRGITSAEHCGAAMQPYHIRYWLDMILSGNAADLGLDYLMLTGALGCALPLLQPMAETEQHKDHHPEGNVWRHTIESLKYRKTADLELSYALLLHDAGKPFAKSENGHKFDKHTQLGRDLAKKILHELGHRNDFIENVAWLVENHSYPAALKRLPQHMSDPLMADSRFPQLLELYRCDISASYSGPENYYAACDVYNRYRKDRGLKRYRPTEE